MYETMNEEEEGGHSSKRCNVQNEKVKLNLTQGGEHHQHHPHPRPLVNEPISHGSSRQWFGYKGLRGGVHPIWTPPRTRRCSNSIKEEQTWVVELEEELTF